MEPSTVGPGYDQALKLLLAQAPDGFLALIAPELHWLAARSPELPAGGRQADMVMEVEDQQRQRGLLHVELQTRFDPELGERLAEYGIRLWRRDHLPVRSVLVFLRKVGVTLTSPFVVTWADRVLLQYHFDIVRLWEIPQELVLETPHIGLWPLASLMAGATVESTVAVAERIARSSLSYGEQSDLTGLLVVLAGLQLSRAEVEQAIRSNQMIKDILNDSTVAQLLKDEGREEGREAGMRETALVVLEGRFGPLSDDVLAALRSVDAAVLRTLLAHVAVEPLEHVRARLGLE